ncbi:MAG: agmatinase [Alphaproteobacteria bacterium]|nr:agmatinase [Alphaproteobacteria bacterium]
METLAPSQGFLGLSDEEAAGTAGKPGVTIVPFGLEASVSYGGGTARGPQAIIDASHQVELFDEELWREPCRDYDLTTLAPFPLETGIPRALDQLEAIVGGILDQGRFPLTLGGEHSLTVGALRPFLKRFDDLVILQFDAHADLRDGYDGEPYSHAAAMRRCLDAPGVSLVSVGVRNISAEEIPFLEVNRERIQIHWAKDKASWNIDEIVAPLAGRPVYLTFDLDGFDASLMPATGTPEPGGLFWDEAINIIRAASRVAGEIVGADIVELAPIAGLHACDFLAAKLAHKILAYRFSGAAR